jgi:hypothetical protein
LRPYLKKKKKSSQKRAGGVTQVIGPEFKPSTSKTNKQKTVPLKEKKKKYVPMYKKSPLFYDRWTGPAPAPAYYSSLLLH